MGKAPPISVKPAPVTDAALTVTEEVPVDVNVTDRVVGEFTFTLPKLKVVVLIESIGFEGVPVPPNDMTAVAPLVELLVMVTWPLAVPVDLGSNCTCSVNDCVGFNV